MAISKQRKEEVQAQYADWVKRSEAVILVEYSGAKMKSLDAIRAKIAKPVVSSISSRTLSPAACWQTMAWIFPRTIS